MICPRCGHDNVPGNDVCESCLLDLAPLNRPPQARALCVYFRWK